MAPTVLYKGSAEIAVLGNVFTVSGINTDPTTVSCVVTDPTGASVTHVYGVTPPNNDITTSATGIYQLQVPCTIPDMWSYVWIATGAVSDITPGTFTVTDTLLNRFYASKEEVKNRMGLDATDTADDDQIMLACSAATRAIESYTHRYFWQGTDTRYYGSDSIEICRVDDIVSVTSLDVDTKGSRVYDQPWIASDYMLQPVNAASLTPEARPFTDIRALAAGGGRYWFPWVYPLSNPLRVKVTGVFGWPQVPWLIKQAALQLAEDLYKLKDAPFGVFGSSEFGMVRVRQNPQIEEMLWHYVRGDKKAGF